MHLALKGVVSGQVNTDTVTLYSINTEQPRIPIRGGVLSWDLATNTSLCYIDSIKFEQQIIDYYHQYYYLKIYDTDSVIRLEGLFFDVYPCSILYTYDIYGEILSFGKYELYQFIKPKVIYKAKKRRRTEVLPWSQSYYSLKTDLWVVKELKRKTVTQTRYNNKERTKMTIMYDFRGKVILEKEEKIKRVKPKSKKA
jgi:hypothetical protein